MSLVSFLIILNISSKSFKKIRHLQTHLLNSPEVRGVRFCATLAYISNIETKQSNSIWHKCRIFALFIIFECLKAHIMLTSKTRLYFLPFLLNLLTPTSLELIFLLWQKLILENFDIRLQNFFIREKLCLFRQCLSPINVKR